MKLQHLGRTLVSGALFYVIAAACGSSDNVGSAAKDGGELDVVAAIDAIVDGVVDPVKDANADPLPPDVATEQCDKQGTVGAATYLYAVHAYAGKTVQDLSAVRVVLHYSNGAAQAPTIGGTNYDNAVTIPVLRDGSAAVFCGSAGSLIYDKATFILPK